MILSIRNIVRNKRFFSYFLIWYHRNVWYRYSFYYQIRNYKYLSSNQVIINTFGKTWILKDWKMSCVTFKNVSKLFVNQQLTILYYTIKWACLILKQYLWVTNNFTHLRCKTFLKCSSGIGWLFNLFRSKKNLYK